MKKSVTEFNSMDANAFRLDTGSNARPTLGSVMGFLTASVKNGEIRSSLSYKIILVQPEERNQLNY